MDTYEIHVSKTIKADAELIYRVLSDYHNEHPRILPKPYFAATEVEQGGVGAGTVVRVQMNVMGMVSHLRLFVTEPVPGREIHEEDPAAGIKTIFTVEPAPDHGYSHVSIRTIPPSGNMYEQIAAHLYMTRTASLSIVISIGVCPITSPSP